MRTTRRDGRRRGPEAFGWTPEDLRSAYAADGSGPYRYAPDGSGPFSYGPDGSGPWLVGPSGDGPAAAWSPRVRRARSGPRRFGSAVVTGALVLALTVGSVGLAAGGPALRHDADTVIHVSEQIAHD